MTYRALEHRFSLHASEGWLGAFLTDALVHLAAPGEPEGARRVHTATADGGQVTVAGPSLTEYTTSATPALAALMTAVNTAAIVSMDVPVLHASAASAHGRAIVIPGHPGAGKSTLVAGLVAAGAGYLTDEAVPLTDDGCAVPYPKPIVVGPGSWPALAHAEAGRVVAEGVSLDAWHLDPARLGSTVETEPVPIGLVAFPRFEPGGATRIEELSPAEATAAMAANAFNLPDHGAAGVRRCAEVAKAVRCVRVVHSDLRDVCARLLEMAP